MGRAPCCEKVGLKKGPWTKDEDQLLINYIHENGHGNWRALPKKAGLLRCGKSCRLRWTNYLRPDIKRGNFTKEEEESIIDLHKELGNKWSAIAARLPGRTDNEIKNIWHTNLKKRLNPPPETVKRVRRRAKPSSNTKKDVEMSCQEHEHTQKDSNPTTTEDHGHVHKTEERGDSHNVRNDEPNSPSQTSSENSTITTTSSTINGGGNASSSIISDVISIEKFLEVDDDDFWADVISGDYSSITTDLPAVDREPRFQSTQSTGGDVYGFDPNMPDEDMEFWYNIFNRDGEIQDMLDF